MLYRLIVGWITIDQFINYVLLDQSVLTQIHLYQIQTCLFRIVFILNLRDVSYIVPFVTKK